MTMVMKIPVDDNDGLILRLFHVTGVQPLFTSGPAGFTATAVTVHIEGDLGDLTGEMQAGLKEWTVGKFGVQLSSVTLVDKSQALG